MEIIYKEILENRENGKELFFMITELENADFEATKNMWFELALTLGNEMSKFSADYFSDSKVVSLAENQIGNLWFVRQLTVKY